MMLQRKKPSMGQVHIYLIFYTKKNRKLDWRCTLSSWWHRFLSNMTYLAIWSKCCGQFKHVAAPQPCLHNLITCNYSIILYVKPMLQVITHELAPFDQEIKYNPRRSVYEYALSEKECCFWSEMTQKSSLAVTFIENSLTVIESRNAAMVHRYPCEVFL